MKCILFCHFAVTELITSSNATKNSNSIKETTITYTTLFFNIACCTNVQKRTLELRGILFEFCYQRQIGSFLYARQINMPNFYLHEVTIIDYKRLVYMYLLHTFITNVIFIVIHFCINWDTCAH